MSEEVFVEMTINVSDIEVGGVYRTPNNQERVVLEYEPGGKVKYTSRGGNVQNEFSTMNECKPERFAEKCSEKIEDLPEGEFTRVRKSFVDRGLVSE
ncbi:hypothetical protein [Serratia marcescens]|uniref:hypothetical protein n=2 Tax=Serratia TaxID=613 RepID=UPI0025AA8DD9|nr:hypothetical protein [Serratia marcescens]MDN0028029.1 hypothetical protein [Serratia marcescens]